MGLVTPLPGLFTPRPRPKTIFARPADRLSRHVSHWLRTFLEAEGVIPPSTDTMADTQSGQDYSLGTKKDGWISPGLWRT